MIELTAEDLVRLDAMGVTVEELEDLDPGDVAELLAVGDDTASFWADFL